MGSGEEVAEYLIHLLDETDIDGFNLTRTVALSLTMTLYAWSFQSYNNVVAIKLHIKRVHYGTKFLIRVITYQNSTLFKRSDVVPITTAKT